MAEHDQMADQPDERGDSAPGERKRKRRWGKRIGWAIAIVFVPVLVLALLIPTPIGKRIVADQIAQLSPASGLQFEVGRIEGDIYNRAILRDVSVKDPDGVFLTIPEVEVDWRPLAWLWSGLDIRTFAARRGRLSRMPQLLAGDPGAPVLPDFDIRIDRLEVTGLTIAEGLAGENAERLDAFANVDIRKGRVLIDVRGEVGEQDGLDLLIDVEPDGDRFGLALDYRAQRDGPIARLAGLSAGYEARIYGRGTWNRWLGHALVLRQAGVNVEDGEPPLQVPVAAFQITNDAGNYGLLGRVTPTLADNSTLDRALGDGVSVAVNGTLVDSVFEGKIAAVSSALDIRTTGAVDLATNRFDTVQFAAVLRRADLFGEAVGLEDARLEGVLEGPFRDLSIRHSLIIGQLSAPGLATLNDLRQSGTAAFDGEALLIALDARLGEAQTGLAALDPHLVGGGLRGAMTLRGYRLAADNARIDFPDLGAQLTFRGDLASGSYRVSGPIDARSLAFENVGEVTGEAGLELEFGYRQPWTVEAGFAGTVDLLANSALAEVAGPALQIDGIARAGTDTPFALNGVNLAGDRLDAVLDGRLDENGFALSGAGTHASYGPFALEAAFTEPGAAGALVLADPLPAAGLSDLTVAFAPRADGLALDIAGNSLLGPIAGALTLDLSDPGAAHLVVPNLRISSTVLRGGLRFVASGASGELAMSGGGVDGVLTLGSGGAQGQAFDVELAARDAQFAGAVPLSIAAADVSASGILASDAPRVSGSIRGSGFQYGSLSIANFDVAGDLAQGRGGLIGSIAGSRADRFALKLEAGFEADLITVLAEGELGGSAITMPEPAVIHVNETGYRLDRAQIGFAGGFAIIEGTVDDTQTDLTAQLAQMPLRLADLAGADLGLGGRLTGILEWNRQRERQPTGRARVRIDDFTRSGLILSSRPMDVYAIVDLDRDALKAGARLREGEGDGTGEIGRLDASITELGERGRLASRLAEGRLDAAFQFGGEAEALWRLLAIDAFDLTGPVDLSAEAHGTLARPLITGTLASDALRLQSAVSGTDITDLGARGRFAGSRLEITSFTGATRGGGTVTGSGIVDLADIGATRGPQIDIRAALNRARLLDASGLEATITGPLRIVSDGINGTIAGRVDVDRARWELGVAAEDMALPQIETREVFRPRDASVLAAANANGSWRYLIDARAPNAIAVDGLGLDSEWGIDLALRGTVSDPRIGGEAQLVRGDYRFAGTRFALTRGRISFDETGPIDPRLNIEAAASASGTDVTIDITGNAQSPQIAFSSTPALPEEEILARLLFGGSVTSLSATDAVQLGGALAALQGGGAGLDPIGELRRSIGLDQLRIVSADPAIGRGTGVALGKNLNRRIYIELLTDGQGYSATQVEYRITSWLALLGNVSTIGRDSVLAEISRDY